MGKAWLRNSRNKSHGQESRLSLKPATEKRLSAYISAATAELLDSATRHQSGCWLVVGAVGLGVLAWPTSAHAGILKGNNFDIYFSAPATGTTRVSVGWDINGDGIIDFVGNALGWGHRSGPCHDDFVQGAIGGDFVGGGPLNSGFQIGPNDAFVGTVGKNWQRYGSFSVGNSMCRSVGGRSGTWRNETGYLGFRFLINGQYHYGWASLGVFVGPGYYHAGANDVFYNSVPDQPILAGQTESPEPSTATLGLLALGSLGLALWRHRKHIAQGSDIS